MMAHSCVINSPLAEYLAVDVFIRVWSHVTRLEISKTTNYNITRFAQVVRSLARPDWIALS